MKQESSKPKFSIVITTEHEEESLLALIRAVAEQAGDKEIEILVTDYSRESRVGAVERLAREEKLPVRCFRMAGSSPFAARNKGLREAKGDVVIFTDDDCIPAAGWLAAYESAFRDPSLGMAGGPDKAPSTVKPFLQALDYVLTSFVGTGGARGAGRTSSAYYPRTWNMALSRNAVEEAGLFDESLPGAQEYDLALRIQDAGLSAECLPGCLVQHRRDTNVVGVFRAGFRSSLGRAFLSRVRPGTGKVVHALPAASGMSCFGLAAASTVWPAAIVALAGAMGLYAALLAASGMHAAVVLHRVRMLALVPAVMATQHFSHAVGFTTGFLLGSFRRSRRE